MSTKTGAQNSDGLPGTAVSTAVDLGSKAQSTASLSTTVHTQIVATEHLLSQASPENDFCKTNPISRPRHGNRTERTQRHRLSGSPSDLEGRQLCSKRNRKS